MVSLSDRPAAEFVERKLAPLRLMTHYARVLFRGRLDSFPTRLPVEHQYYIADFEVIEVVSMLH